MSVRNLLLTGMASGPLLLASCASTGHSRSPAPAAVADAGGLDLEREYLIGPSAARDLGYRILFQSQINPDHDSGIGQVKIAGDSIFVLDGHNFLSRLRRSDGQRLWRIPVASPYNEVQGITYLSGVERVFLTVEGDLYELDDNTGSLLDRQDLGSIASTPPVVLGGFFIYGARNGEVVWHSWQVGHTWRAYNVSPAMRLTPILVDNLLIAVGSDGRVMVLDARHVTGVWDKRLLNGVDAQPVAGKDIVYIAGLDQYLWAIDIYTGRTHWKHLTEAPLHTGPTLIGDHVYQEIPGYGLHCFDASPPDSPGGVILWANPDVTGRVIGQVGGNLLVWSRTDGTVTQLDADRGDTISTTKVPAVSHLMMSEPVDGDLVAAGDDGRVTRLVLRHGQ